MWANYTDYFAFVPNPWSINPKVSKDLADTPCNGDILNYKEWHDLLRNHLLSANQGYGRITKSSNTRKCP